MIKRVLSTVLCSRSLLHHVHHTTDNSKQHDGKERPVRQPCNRMVNADSAPATMPDMMPL